MQVNRIAVIGTGTMGNGIAGQAAISGFDVKIYDVNPPKAAQAIEAINRTYDKGLSRGKVTEGQVKSARERLDIGRSITDVVGDADLVVEAIPERMDLKQKLFKELEDSVGQQTIFATNTSSLSITEIAHAVSKPERVVGMHFFNPVAVMPLVELVKGEYTSSEVLDEVRRVAESMGKQCIEVIDSPGFATSRLGITLGNEAMRMFQEGVASAEDIDKAMVLGYRHPIGPLALTDLVGLDVRLAITEHLFQEIGSDTFRPPRILRQMVRAGRLGRKTGRGFYDYS